MSWYKEVPQLEKHLIDLATVATVVGTLTSYLPALSALLAIVWTSIRIWETETIRAMTGRTKPEKEEDDG